MSRTITYRGQTYRLPTNNDPDWGTPLNDFLSALAAGSASAGPNVFDVTADEFGAIGDGVTDDTEAIEAAIDAATAWRFENELEAVVFLPAGTYLVRRPLYLTSKMTIAGAGREASVLSFISGVKGYNVIIGDDKSAGPSIPQYTTALLSGGGQALVQGGDVGYAIDLTQSDEVRLVKGQSRTLSFAFKATDASQLSDVWTVAYWGGRLNQSQSQATLLQLRSDPDGLKLIFRYNGQGFFVQVATASLPGAISANTTYNIEIAWASTTLRVFVNGELWTLGNWTPTGGSGSSDSSGFVSYPWEALTFGAGGTSYNGGEDAAQGSVPFLDSVVDAIHFSSAVRHTASFTNPTAKPSADTSTLVLINFDEFFKGNVVAKGFNGVNKTYFYPITLEVAAEQSRVTLRDFRMIGGMGLRAEFASLMMIERVTHLYPCDGWRFTFNGYFSSFRDISIEGGVGRAAWYMGPWSYVSLVSVHVAGPICFYFNSANAFGLNLNATIQASYYLGMFFGFGTGNFTGFNVDAEIASTAKFERSLMVVEPLGARFSSCTLLGPPNSTVAPINLVNDHASDAGYPVEFDKCMFGAVPSGEPFIEATGGVAWAPAAVLKNPLYGNVSRPAIADPLAAAVDPDSLAHAQSVRLGAAAPVSGAWARGNVVYNSAPSAGGYLGWVCTAAGTPGTWKGFGAIEA